VVTTPLEGFADEVGKITGKVSREQRQGEARTTAALDAVIALLMDLETRIAALEHRSPLGARVAGASSATELEGGVAPAAAPRPRLVHLAGD
jgi:hypothetical protein